MRQDSVLPAEIHQECRRRIEGRYHSVNRTVALGDGGAPAYDMLLDIERLRACEAYLLGLDPMPAGYRSDHYWQGYPPGFRFTNHVTETAAAVPQQVQHAPPPYYPLYHPHPAPQVIVIPQGGGSQQVVNTGTAAPAYDPSRGAPQVYSHPNPAPIPYGSTAAMPYGAHGSQEGHVPGPLPGAVPVVPGGSSPAVAPPLTQRPSHAASGRTTKSEALGNTVPANGVSTWTEIKEQMYQATVRALNGEQSFVDLITPFAAREGMDLTAFCHRIGGERAEAMNHFAAHQAQVAA
jgi:hypothetical protein